MYDAGGDVEINIRKKILFLLSGIQLNYPEAYTHIVFFVFLWIFYQPVHGKGAG